MSLTRVVLVATTLSSACSDPRAEAISTASDVPQHWTLVGTWTGSFKYAEDDTEWREDTELDIWTEIDGALSGLYTITETEVVDGADGEVQEFLGELTGHHFQDDDRVVIYLVTDDLLFEGEHVDNSGSPEVLNGEIVVDASNSTIRDVAFSRESGP